MRQHTYRWMSGLAMACLLVPQVRAVSIQFDYTYDTGFFADAERRALLEQAGSYYLGFSDTLSAITPQSGDGWSVWFNNPSNLGSGLVRQQNLSVAADTLTVFVGGSAMGSGVLGYAMSGLLDSVTGSGAFVDAVYTRGQANATGVSATDYGWWGGAISFNSDANWYWGETADGLDGAHNDFLTTAIHELAHLFGYGSADSWFNQIEDGLFTGEASVASYGTWVPVGGGGAHWAEGVMSTVDGMVQETLMDPSTPAGVRQLLTDLDYAGLQDIGWEVSAVPVPPALWLFGSGLAALAWPGASRRRTAVERASKRQVAL